MRFSLDTKPKLSMQLDLLMRILSLLIGPYEIRNDCPTLYSKLGFQFPLTQSYGSQNQEGQWTTVFVIVSKIPWWFRCSMTRKEKKEQLFVIKIRQNSERNI